MRMRSPSPAVEETNSGGDEAEMTRWEVTAVASMSDSLTSSVPSMVYTHTAGLSQFTSHFTRVWRVTCQHMRCFAKPYFI